MTCGGCGNEEPDEVWEEGDNIAWERFKHLAGKARPIFSKQAVDQGWDAVAGWFSFPIYGETPEQKRERKKERLDKRRSNKGSSTMRTR